VPSGHLSTSRQLASSSRYEQHTSKYVVDASCAGGYRSGRPHRILFEKPALEAREGVARWSNPSHKDEAARKPEIPLTFSSPNPPRERTAVVVRDSPPQTSRSKLAHGAFAPSATGSGTPKNPLPGRPELVISETDLSIDEGPKSHLVGFG